MIPKYVSEIIYKSTFKEPKDRIKNVEEMIDLLEINQSSWWKRIFKK